MFVNLRVFDAGGSRISAFLFAAIDLVERDLVERDLVERIPGRSRSGGFSLRLD